MSNTIDARGRSCPEPVIMTKNFIDKSPAENFSILVDSHVAVENITRFATGKGYNINVDENQGEFTINIRK